MEVKSHFEKVDQLIAKVKSATAKNKTIQAKFATIGYLPQPDITRWRSWLNAALYYAENLPEVKSIKSFEGSGILVTQAKVSMQTNGLTTRLLKIKSKTNMIV